VNAQPVIAVVDDDASVRLALGNLLQSFGLDVALFGSGAELLAYDDLDKFSCLLTDIQMPQMSGFGLCDALRERSIGLPIIFMTAFQRDDDREQAEARQAVSFLNKPFRDADIIDSIARALGYPPGTWPDA
jgi:FixJ family two-component response regulator